MNSQRGTALEAPEGPRDREISRLPSAPGRSRAVLASLLLSGVILPAVLLLAGCGGSGGSQGTGPGAVSSAGKPALRPVKIRLSWLPSAEYAGIIVAVHNGYYRQQGLDVAIDPGGVGLNSIELVAAGADDIGLAGGDSLLVARSRGVPVQAFAVEFQQSPQVFFARKSSGITTPQQWPGHTVGIKVGKTAETMYNALVGKLHLNASQIKTMPVKASLQPFYAGQVDVWPGFIFDEAAEAQAAGIPINIIDPASYGVILYSDAIFTTDKTIQSDPALVRGFLKGTQQGWEWTRDHPAQALQLVMQAYPHLDRAHEKVRLDGTIPRVAGTPQKPVKPIGKMDPATWADTYQMLATRHLLKSSFPVTQAYTLQFLR